jgi:hypothetical protein
MIDALLTALKTIYTGSAALVAAFPGGYFVKIAPEGVPLKSVIAEVVSAPLQLTYGTAKDADVRVQFTIFAKSGDGGPLIETFMGVYDAAVPSLTPSADCSNVVRQNEPIPFMLTRKDRDGDEVWGWMVDYVYSVHKA